MVKFGKNKLKALNKLAKKQKSTRNDVLTSNKVLKKKENAERKVTFQKQVLLKETLSGGSSLVKSVKAHEVILNELSNQHPKKREKKKTQTPDKVQKPTPKPVEKKKKRQKTMNCDTRLLLKLMSKK